MNQKESLLFGLVGCGQIGKRHAKLINELGILHIVCDIDKEKADTFAEEYEVFSCYDYTFMLQNYSELDVVVICTPNSLHASQSIAALNNGMHVLCEKPMALFSHDCTRMIEATKVKKKFLQIVKQNKFNPPIKWVKDKLLRKKLGRIFSIQVNCFWNRPNSYYENSKWRGKIDLDGGPLYTQFSHFLDILCAWFGKGRFVSGSCCNANHQNVIEFEDTGFVILEFDHAECFAGIHYSLNAFEKNAEGSISIIGEKGIIKIGGAYLNIIEYVNIEDEDAPVLEKGNAANIYGDYQGSMSNHKEVYLDFIHSIINNTYDENVLESPSNTVELIEEIYDHFRGPIDL
jgi:predicted dehydrogenase